MKVLKIINKLLIIVNAIIGCIIVRKFGVKISLIFWGSILLGGIEGIIFSAVNEE